MLLYVDDEVGIGVNVVVVVVVAILFVDILWLAATSLRDDEVLCVNGENLLLYEPIC